VRPDTGHEPLRPKLFPQDAEHLPLEVYRDHGTGITNPPGKLAGEETRSAANVKDAVAGLNVPLCEAVGPVQEPPEAGVEMPGMLGRENLVVTGAGDSRGGG
jgi:hypothetical protein